MAGGGGHAPLPPSSPSTGGEFLLSLLQKQTQPPQPSQSPPPPPPQSLTRDPAVAAVGPTIPFLPYPPPSNGHDLSSPPYPPNFFLQGFPRNPFPPPGNQFPGNSFPGNHFPGNNFPHNPLGTEVRKLGSQQKHEPELMFGSLRCEIKNHQGLSNGKSIDSSIPGSDREGSSSKFEISKSRELGLGHRSYTNRQFESQGNSSSRRIDNYAFRKPQDSVVRTASQEPPRPPPPGFPAKPRGGRDWDSGNRRKSFENNVGVERGNFGKLNNRVLSSIDEDARRRRVSQDYSKERELGLTDQLDRPGPPTGINLHSVSASEIEESSLNLPAEIDEIPNEHGGLDNELGLHENHDSLGEQLRGSLTLEDRASEKNDKRKHHNSRDKDIRSDYRGKWLLSQRLRNMKRLLICRRDIDMLNAPFLGIYQSLVPAEEEKAKQKQLFTLLETTVSKEWPKSQLYLYGSCANSFGVSKSDIDVCLAIDDAHVNKSEILLRLADILQSDNLQNVQALTRARVPIVKLKDPVTGISCDICINNVLAVVNTKLLRDYAQIDVRLRQLAFIVKHWAKSRGVNETYQGTLSSYAYVVMCIHFLQQRQPAILPCLQGMETTYRVTVDDVECAFFDRVEKLRDFGSRNKESIAQLVWAFFSYWAYCHDYANDVISVRTGSIISKQSKDWTKRIGNDRHLICIEDPFEISHDLGRVVDKYSIRVLREEFERAADIMQYDPNPCVTLFEPYSPQVGILHV